MAGYSRLLVAFSGGLDSTVLLHQLCQQRHCHDLSLRAIHIHHGLSPHADEWLQHCQAICAGWQIAFSAYQLQLTSRGIGTEAEARRLRYQVFAEALQPGEALVTAHHQDDQCETLLLALKRGSGPAGMAAMPVRRTFSGHSHLRPLLQVSRQQLNEYAIKHHLTWIEDESNQDLLYDRNFLRHSVIPVLEQRWPAFCHTVARSAALCGEQEQLLDELLQEELKVVITPQDSLLINDLKAASQIKRNAIIRRWLAHCQAPVASRDAIHRIWHEVAMSRQDATPQLQLGEGSVRRYQDQLWWVRAFAGQKQRCLPWPVLSQPLELPDNLGTLSVETAPLASGKLPFRQPYSGEKVSIRFTIVGKVYPQGRTGGRELKKLWQEFQVPPWRRGSIPIVFYNEQPVCVADLFVTQEGHATPQQAAICLIWSGGANAGALAPIK